MRFELYQSNRQWRWRYRGVNGRILAGSGEAYVNKSDVINSIRLIRMSGFAPIVEV